jgi:DNA-binding response OmpR family regulator
MRLLLVDDDEILRCLLVDQLTRAGHTVDEAVDGKDALTKINAEIYDAVICDWEMPNLDGPALCRAVRAGRHGRELYFIMLSGRTTPIEQADGYDAGVDAFLTKPCDHTDLLAALRTAQSIAEMPVRKAS